MTTNAKDGGLETIRKQLGEAVKARKCHGCGCFLRALEALERRKSVSKALTPLLASAKRVALPKEYDCLGCAVCWPAVALGALVEADPLSAEAVERCPTDFPVERSGWPPLPGDYHVVRYGAPVAVCTLNSDVLARRLAELAPEGLAIAGILRTENLGIERIIVNVRANPNIRFLILCGEDTRQPIGHLPGHSLKCLITDGADQRGRIRGALGKRPIVRNVTGEQVDAFRQQVSLIDRIGELDEMVIVRDVAESAAHSLGPFETAPGRRPVKIVEAQEPRHLILDPAGYFVVYPDARNGCLVLEHYTKAGLLDRVLQGGSSASLYSTAIEQGLLSRLDHAAYLGRELARAEDCLRTGEHYVQDRAPGEVSPEAEREPCGCGSICTTVGPR